MKHEGSDRERVAALIGQSYLFCDLPSDVLVGSVLPHGRAVEFARQETIFSPRGTVDRVGVILKGSVHILNLFSDGRYSLMSVLKAPMTLGADLICTKTRRPPYDAVCASPARILFFPMELFLRQGLLREADRAEVTRRLLTLVSQENIQKYYRLAILSQKGLRDRVWTYLTMQAQRRNTASFEIPFSREELAAFLCVNRSALSHELSLMRREGLIDFHKNAFTLLAAGEGEGARG